MIGLVQGGNRRTPDAGRRREEIGERSRALHLAANLALRPPPLPPSGGGRRLNMKMNHTIGFATRFWITIQCDG